MSDAETRLHFRIGYLGDAFHGSQIQPDVRTVQGELIHAFEKLGWISKDAEEHNLVLSSRTDAGVHVRLNGELYALPNRFGTALHLASSSVQSTTCSLTKFRSSMFVKLPWIGIRGWQNIASIAIVSKASNFGTIRETFLLNGSNFSRGHTMRAILLDWNQERTQFEPFSRVHHGLSLIHI